MHFPLWGTKPRQVLSMGGRIFGEQVIIQPKKALLKELAHGSNTIKAVGQYAGYGGLAITGLDMYMNSLDAIMGIVSFIPGWGWIAGGIYLFGNATVEAATGKNIGQHIDELIY